MDAALLFIGGLVTLLLFLGYLHSLRYIFQYQVKDRVLRVRLFGAITLRRIRIDDIVDMRPVSVWPFGKDFRLDSLWAEAWPSYVFTSTAVLIRKSSGISRKLVLSPQNPDEFIREVLSHRQSRL